LRLLYIENLVSNAAFKFNLYRYTAANSIELRIRELQDKKRKLTDTTLNGGAVQPEWYEFIPFDPYHKRTRSQPLNPCHQVRETVETGFKIFFFSKMGQVVPVHIGDFSGLSKLNLDDLKLLFRDEATAAAPLQPMNPAAGAHAEEEEEVGEREGAYADNSDGSGGGGGGGRYD
jgi:hypothetical protein